jgi:hypothetical protein
MRQFTGKIRKEGSIAQGFDDEAYKTALQIVHWSQF